MGLSVWLGLWCFAQLKIMEMAQALGACTRRRKQHGHQLRRHIAALHGLPDASLCPWSSPQNILIRR